MAESFVQHLEAWHEFYLVVGGAAAALTGLMFVVISIGPEIIASRAASGVRSFVSPTIVYFTTVLAVSALMTMPHVAPRALAAVLALGSVAGLAYMVWIRGHKQWREGKLGLDDWIWYIALPVLAYVLLMVAALGMWRLGLLGSFSLGIAMILFLVIGIRNAWDLILWFAQKRKP
jgi:modulator of FtsH protease